METLYNCLKHRGKIIIEVPDYKSMNTKTQKSYWQRSHSPRYMSLLTHKGFALLFQKDKWEIRKHFRYGTLNAFTIRANALKNFLFSRFYFELIHC